MAGSCFFERMQENQGFWEVETWWENIYDFAYKSIEKTKELL